MWPEPITRLKPVGTAWLGSIAEDQSGERLHQPVEQLFFSLEGDDLLHRGGPGLRDSDRHTVPAVDARFEIDLIARPDGDTEQLLSEIVECVRRAESRARANDDFAVAVREDELQRFLNLLLAESHTDCGSFTSQTLTLTMADKSKIAIYARVSTDEQTVDPQLRDRKGAAAFRHRTGNGPPRSRLGNHPHCPRIGCRRRSRR
jgi:hypothetical protein